MSDEAPKVGTVINDTDCLIVKQISEKEANLYFTDEKGKVLALKEVKSTFTISPEAAAKIMNQLLTSDYKMVHSGNLDYLQVEQPNGEFITFRREKSLYLKEGPLKYKFGADGLVYFNFDGLKIQKIKAGEIYTTSIPSYNSEREYYFLGGSNKATFQAYYPFEEVSSDIEISIKNELFGPIRDSYISFNYIFLKRDTNSNFDMPEEFVTGISPMGLKFGDNDFVLPKRVLKGAENFIFNIEMFSRFIRERVTIEYYRGSISPENKLEIDTSRANSISIPKDSTDKIIVVIKNKI
ncbi:MAG: hypothetical protein ACTTJM_03035 [Bergeyella cardium]